jgi:hypothetical protein
VDERVGHVLGAGHERRDEDRDNRVDLAGCRDDLDRALVIGRARGGDHVDGVGGGRGRGQEGREAFAGRLAQLGNGEVGGLAGVGAQDPEAAGVRHDGDPVAHRHRL